MEKAIQANLKLWNEWTKIHEKSESYDLEGFKAGKNRLHPIELLELGNEVAGKELLHLQCHFGLDTLSWARLGARVTGVDFSGEAIELARSISTELTIQGRFIQSEISVLPQKLTEQFDIVYTSYGVLTWLPDLKRWAGVVSHFLRPGGIFYMVEFHPLLMVFDDAENEQGLKIGYPYFRTDEPMEIAVQGSYADRTAKVSQKVSYEWSYSVGDVMNNLIEAGLEIQYFHEYPYSVEPILNCMVAGDDGYYRIKGFEESLPLMFSLRAVKK